METYWFLSFIIGLSCEINQQKPYIWLCGRRIDIHQPTIQYSRIFSYYPRFQILNTVTTWIVGSYLLPWLFPYIYSMSHNSMSIPMIVMEIDMYIYIYLYLSLSLLTGTFIIPKSQHIDIVTSHISYTLFK